MLSRDPFIRPFSSLWFNQGDLAMITHCIISDMANVSRVTCPVCMKYRRQTVFWSERRNGFILSTRSVSRTRPGPGQDTGVTSLGPGPCHTGGGEERGYQDHKSQQETRPGSGEITISNSSWKIICHPQEEDFHTC